MTYGGAGLAKAPASSGHEDIIVVPHTIERIRHVEQIVRRIHYVDCGGGGGGTGGQGGNTKIQVTIDCNTGVHTKTAPDGTRIRAIGLGGGCYIDWGRKFRGGFPAMPIKGVGVMFFGRVYSTRIGVVFHAQHPFTVGGKNATAHIANDGRLHFSRWAVIDW